MGSGNPILWHISISHYSEKARWALEYKGVEHERRSPPPGSHIAVALWRTRGRGATFPVLELDGERLGDSSAIIAALERRFPDPPLYPADPAERERALALEEFFDEELAPYMRRFTFHELRRDPERFTEIVGLAAPELFARAGWIARPFALAFTGLRYGARSAARAAEARERVVAAMDRLEAELGDGEYLVGGRFTVADLTAAALFYPMVRPPESTVTLPPLTDELERFRATLESRRGFRWVRETYRRHRRAAAPEPARVG